MSGIVGVRPTSPTSIKVVFSDVVRGRAGYVDPDSYHFTGGLETLGVMLLGDFTVEVYTTPQDHDTEYNLEVNIEEEEEKEGQEPSIS